MTTSGSATRSESATPLVAEADWSHSLSAKIDADKFIAEFRPEWEDYGKPDDKLGFLRESADMMGSDFFDGPWVVGKVNEVEDIGVYYGAERDSAERTP